MKPNEARITGDMRYCFEQLLKLHRNAKHNIFFCFTNAPRGPGDSLDTLEQLLAETKGKLQYDITLDRFEYLWWSISFRSNCFSFDNSCIRYLNIVRQHSSMKTEDLDKQHSEIWLKNVDMTKRFQNLFFQFILLLRLLQAISEKGRIQLKNSCNIINVDKRLLFISEKLSKCFPSLPKVKQSSHAAFRPYRKLKQ